ncbi:MAG: hypothetical protein RL076_1788, partial [Chloroflexota bacterium]
PGGSGDAQAARTTTVELHKDHHVATSRDIKGVTERGVGRITDDGGVTRGNYTLTGGLHMPRLPKQRNCGCQNGECDEYSDDKDWCVHLTLYMRYTHILKKYYMIV